MGETQDMYRILVGKTVMKHPLRRLRSRWKDNIKLDFKETGYEDVR
jgi:hypothetical protein